VRAIQAPSGAPLRYRHGWQGEPWYNDVGWRHNRTPAPNGPGPTRPDRIAMNSMLPR
jgi:hypothetical protein